MKDSIMPVHYRWSTAKKPGLHKHHIFGGANRKLSDEDGLFIYLTAEMHNMSDRGIHFNREFDLFAKQVAEETWCTYYDKTIDDFIKKYGRNYI